MEKWRTPPTIHEVRLTRETNYICRCRRTKQNKPRHRHCISCTDESGILFKIGHSLIPVPNSCTFGLQKNSHTVKARHSICDGGSGEISGHRAFVVQDKWRQIYRHCVYKQGINQSLCLHFEPKVPCDCEYVLITASAHVHDQQMILWQLWCNLQDMRQGMAWLQRGNDSL